MSLPVRIFHDAAAHVPAYRAFLREHGVRIHDIQRLSDFRAVPPTDKHSYVHKYPLNERLREGDAPSMLYASSGSSGQPTFWPVDGDLEAIGVAMHEDVLGSVMQIPKHESTLAIVAFSMGIWVAGGFTTHALRGLQAYGRNITVATPSIETDTIIQLLQSIAPQYDNTVLIGYAPFLRNVLARAKRRHCTLPQRLHLLTSGDRFSEQWRQRMQQVLPGTPPAHRIINLYGCADAAALAHETPVTMCIRKAATQSRPLMEALCGEQSPQQPGVFQYRSRHRHLESHDGEIHVSSNGAVPLVRYNLHDRGRVWSPAEMQSLLAEHNLLEAVKNAPESAQWLSYPMVTVHGRTDVAVRFYAINLYPEHIAAGLHRPAVRRQVSGAFYAFAEESTRHTPEKLHIAIELAPSVSPSKKLAASLEQELIRTLRQYSIEYCKLSDTIGEAAHPIIHLVPHGAAFTQHGNAGVLQLAGKKPRMY